MLWAQVKSSSLPSFLYALPSSLSPSAHQLQQREEEEEAPSAHGVKQLSFKLSGKAVRLSHKLTDPVLARPARAAGPSCDGILSCKQLQACAAAAFSQLRVSRCAEESTQDCKSL
eukprot:762828-Hanusia_phi.AAC.2